MVRKRAIGMLGMALLVMFTGFAARAQSGDVHGPLGVEAAVLDAQTMDRQECARDGGSWDEAAGVCEIEAP